MHQAPYWTYFVPIGIAVLGTVQAFGIIWVGAKIKDTTKAVNKMEEQINSNMERQIKQAIGEALARYKLRQVQDELAVVHDAPAGATDGG